MPRRTTIRDVRPGITHIRIISDMSFVKAGLGSSGDVLAGDDALVHDYLTRSRKAAWYLPRDRRELVLRQVADRIAGALAPAQTEPVTHQAHGTQPPSEPTQPLSSTGDVADLLAKLGKPKDLVRAIDGFPGTEAGWLEYAAIILVLFGGLFFSLGWVIGLVLLWVSARWRWQDKLLATLVWPGGLLVARLLMEHYLINSVSSAGARGSVSFIIDATLGNHHALRHFFILALAVMPPALVAIWLLRRARRPRLPAAPWPTGQPRQG